MKTIKEPKYYRRQRMITLDREVTMSDGDVLAVGTEVPARDAPWDQLIAPDKDDIEKGKPQDEWGCMYCRRCWKIFGSDFACVVRRTARVLTRDEKGRYVIWRYILSDPARRMIKKFDSFEDVPPLAVLFRKPVGTTRIDSTRTRHGTGGKKVAHMKASVAEPLFMKLRKSGSGKFPAHVA